MAAAPPPPPLWRRPALWLGLWLALFLAWGLAPGHPLVAGLFHDDGIYWCLGKGLLQEGVYRDLHSPEPIRIAKYPPGMPLLAALAQGAAATPEEGLALARLLGGLWLGLALAAWWRLLGREGGAAARLRIPLVAALAFNPSLLDLGRIPMSEPPYLALSLLALLALVRSEAAPERPWRQGAALALLAFLCCLFRTVGLGLAAAVGLHLLLQRRRATALVYGGLALGAIGLLQLFLAAHARPAPGFADLKIYGLPYTQILADGLPWLPRVVATNTLQMFLYAGHQLVPCALPWAAGGGDGGWALLWVLAAGTGLLLAAGIRQELGGPPAGGGGRVRPWHLHLLFALAFVIPWPFQVARFLVPLFPFLALLAVKGAARLGGPRAAVLLAWLMAAAALAGGLPSRLRQSEESFTIEGRSWNLKETLALARELAARPLPGKAVAASTLDPLFAVHAGLPGVWAWTIGQAPLDLYGGQPALGRFLMDFDRYTWIWREREAARRFFRDQAAGGEARQGEEREPLLAAFEEARPQVREQFRRVGVTHAILLLDTGQTLYEVLLARLVRELAAEGRAQPLSCSPSGGVQLWRIQP